MTDEDLTPVEEPAVDGTESAVPVSDTVAFELTTEEPVVEASVDPVEAELVENEAPSQRLVLNTEEAWTAQSQHGVLLNHFVPTQNYAALDTPANQTDFADSGNDW